jgi:DNA-directed RNA polymerase specialized sigma24 family protein
MNQIEFYKLPLHLKIFRLAKRLLISKEEDATQEVLSKLWSKMIASSIWAV